jgi:hypothetical protein
MAPGNLLRRWLGSRRAMSFATLGCIAALLV